MVIERLHPVTAPLPSPLGDARNANHSRYHTMLDRLYQLHPFAGRRKDSSCPFVQIQMEGAPPQDTAPMPYLFSLVPLPMSSSSHCPFATLLIFPLPRRSWHLGGPRRVPRPERAASPPKTRPRSREHPMPALGAPHRLDPVTRGRVVSPPASVQAARTSRSAPWLEVRSPGDVTSDRSIRVLHRGWRSERDRPIVS